jgi:hypothetical protein
MNDGENQQTLSEYLVYNDVWERSDYKLARCADPPRTAAVRHQPQTLDGIVDGTRHPVGGFKAPILLDVLGDLL